MSVLVMSRVFGDPKHSSGPYANGSKHAGSELLVLLSIADSADDDGYAFPSVATLARKCRLSDRYVNMLLSKLRDSGELEIGVNQGRAGANLYRVLVGLPSEAGFTPLKPASPRSPLPEGVKPASEGGEARFPKPLKPASPEPSLNRQGTTKEPKRARAKRAARAQVKRSIPDDFGLSEPVRAWAAIKGFDRLQEHLEAFVGKCKAKGYQYADWDAAFMEAVRKDWAGVRAQGGNAKWRKAHGPGQRHVGIGQRDFMEADAHGIPT